METNTTIDKSILRDDDIIQSDDGLVFDPYNELNEEIILSDVQSILTKYGVPGMVTNMNLYTMLAVKANTFIAQLIY